MFYEKGEFKHKGFSIGEKVLTKDGEGIIICIDLDDDVFEFIVSFVDNPIIDYKQNRIILNGIRTATIVKYTNELDWNWYEHSDLSKITNQYNSISITPHPNTKTLYNQTLALINQQHKILEKSLLDSEVIKRAMIESIGFVLDAVVESIIKSLELNDDNQGILFGLISDCLWDDDTFEYMIKKLENFYL